MYYDQHSRSDDRRWWWHYAAAGVAVAATLVAIPVAASNARPDGDPDAPAERQRMRGGVSSANAVEHRLLIGRFACPTPPDVRYVGVPWVPPVPTGCASVDRWWTAVEEKPAW